MSMLVSHVSVYFFVLCFVLPCAYAYVASENQAIWLKWKRLKIDDATIQRHYVNIYE